MNRLELTDSNAASLPPPDAGIAALLEQAPVPAVLPDFKDNSSPAVASAAITPSPVTPAVPWRPPLTVGPFLARSLGARWELYRAQLRSCQKEFSEETVHELRVATRRLMAQIVMVSFVTPGKAADKTRRVLKRRLKALGELRDTHVQRLFIERHLARFPGLFLVRDFLQRRERRLEKAAAAKVKAFKARKLEALILKLGDRLASRPSWAGRPDRLLNVVVGATGQAFAEVVRRRQAIDPAEPGTIHRTRIAFKKFRYMVESLSPDLTGLEKRDLRALAYYQRRMGNLQDLEVMQQCITAYVAGDPGREAVLRPFVRYLKARRARALRGFLASADDLFAFWPPGSAAAGAEPPAAQAAA